MKIGKGPGNYSVPPAPPDDPKGGESTNVSSFQSELSGVREGGAAREKSSVGKSAAFEAGLSEIARASKTGNLSGEATVGKVVDSVIEQMMGKDFAAGPHGASMKSAMVPMLSQDEVFMGKLNSVLSRLGKP